MATETATKLACATCGESDNIQAWYDVPESQGIDLHGIGEDGSVEYDYNGITKAGDGASDDHGYYCSGCCTYSDSLEELLGLPRVPHVSTLAALFAEGQRIPELDDDDFRELVELVTEERQRRSSEATV